MTLSPTPHDGNEPDKSAAIVNSNPDDDKPDLRGDWSNFFLLLLLYGMQGIPLGLCLAVPILLQSKKNVTYQEQALLSLTSWPFSAKILWAPFVDVFYVQKIGRRKSWLIPVQLLMGACFVYLATDIDDLLPETRKPSVWKLVCAVSVIKLLMTTQDIVVDGWALTMLKKKNVGYASTCNMTGQTIGITVGCQLSVLLTSEDFCNKYLRAAAGTGGVTNLRSLLYVWSVLFVVITILIALFKKEKDNRLEDDHVKLNIFQNYSLLWNIIKLPSIRILAMALLTVKIGFAPDSMLNLKLIDGGLRKDDIMIILVVQRLIKIIIPLVVAKNTSGPQSMSIYVDATPFRLFWNIPFVALIYYTPKLINTNGIIDIPRYYYAILISILSIHDIVSNIMTVAILSFFSRISDSRFGGTYMTLLNTLSNLGHMWSSSVAIGMVDFLTFKECSLNLKNNCSTKDLQNTCLTNGGVCNITVNGYYVEMAVCTVIGIVWFGIFRDLLKNLQSRSRSDWLVEVKKPTENNDDENAYSMS